MPTDNDVSIELRIGLQHEMLIELRIGLQHVMLIELRIELRNAMLIELRIGLRNAMLLKLRQVSAGYKRKNRSLHRHCREPTSRLRLASSTVP